MNTTHLMQLAAHLFVKRTPKTRDEALVVLKKVDSVCKQLDVCGYHSTAVALHEAYSSDVVFMGFALNATIH